MPEVQQTQFAVSPWKRIATELFFDEFEDPKDFHEQFSDPVDVYYELARRVTRASVRVEILPGCESSLADPLFLAALNARSQVHEAAAYTVMNQAFTNDAAANTKRELLALKKRYLRIINKQEG